MKNKNILYILAAIFCTILILVYPDEVTNHGSPPFGLFYLGGVIQVIAVTVLLLYVIKHLKE